MAWHKASFEGMSGLELQTESLRLFIVTEFGPRIAFLGRPEGDNLLFWDNKNLGRNDWLLRGGHRVWMTRPGADESEDCYRPDNEPCDVQIEGDSITATSAIDPLLQVRRGIEISLIDRNRLSVDNFVINAGDMLYSGGVWALTCTNPKPGWTYGIPLGDDSVWDCFRLVVFRKWAGHTSPVNDSQISFTEDMLLVNPQGIETKRLIEAQHGIMAMNAPDAGTTFIKRADYDRTAQYPMGCNLAFYVGPDNFMVEMESMGGEVALKPGETAHNVETWLLTDEAIGLESASKILEISL